MTEEFLPLYIRNNYHTFKSMYSRNAIVFEFLYVPRGVLYAVMSGDNHKMNIHLIQ